MHQAASPLHCDNYLLSGYATSIYACLSHIPRRKQKLTATFSAHYYHQRVNKEEDKNSDLVSYRSISNTG